MSINNQNLVNQEDNSLEYDNNDHNTETQTQKQIRLLNIKMLSLRSKYSP